MADTNPYKFIWFGDIHGPKPYESLQSRATNISQTPVVHTDCDKHSEPIGSKQVEGA